MVACMYVSYANEFGCRRFLVEKEKRHIFALSLSLSLDAFSIERIYIAEKKKKNRIYPKG
jgi:hypothetical protein